MTCLKHVTLERSNVNFRHYFWLEFVPWICYSSILSWCHSYRKRMQSKACLVALLIHLISHRKIFTCAEALIQFFLHKIEWINRATKHVSLHGWDTVDGNTLYFLLGENLVQLMALPKDTQISIQFGLQTLKRIICKITYSLKQCIPPIPEMATVTHWGRVMHIYVSATYGIIVSDNGL